MLVRTKISFLTVCILAALGALSLFAARWFVLGIFDRLERESAAGQALRAAALIRTSAEGLASTLGDWALWDDSYAFAGGERPGYPEENFQVETLVNLDVNLVAFIGPDASLVYAKAVDLAGGVEEPVPRDMVELLRGWTYNASGPGRASGLVVIAGLPWLVAVSPVLPTGGNGTPRGLMAMARRIDDRFVGNLSEILGLPVSVTPEEEPPVLEPEPRALPERALPPPESGKPAWTAAEIVDRRTIAGYARVEGFGGSPGARIRILEHRTIRSVGIRSYVYFAAALGLLISAAAISQLVLFQRLVVERIIRLGRDLDLLDTRDDPGIRMTVAGNDELSRFASALNAALDKLAAARSRLEQARRGEALADLAGGMAHEFNNILAIILGALESAGTRARTEEERGRLLGTARAAALRGRDIVEQVLLHARTARTERRPADLRRVVDEALEQVAVLARPDIEFRRRYAPMPPVPVNEGLVAMLVVNVVKNALDAIGAGPGTVSVSLDPEEVGPGPGEGNRPPPGRYARLSLEDSGRGMDPQELAHAFDPFFTTKSPGTGLGLGLAVVKGVMRQHDGYIDASSEPGKGSRFTFHFPLGAPGEGLPPEPEGAQSRGAPPPSGRLLLVGTEPALALAERGLGMLGYAVRRAEDEAAALDSLNRCVGDIDLVIADEGVGEAGLEALARAARGSPRLRLLVCAVPGARALPGSGVHAVLAKPVPIRSLIAAVEEALSAP